MDNNKDRQLKARNLGGNFGKQKTSANISLAIWRLKSRASEILSKKRKLTLEMIRLLHDTLKIPTEVLIQTYKLTKPSH